MTILERAKAALGFGPKPVPASTAPKGKSALQQNAEKALRMKQEAGPQTHIPEPQTSHEGGVGEPQLGRTDTMVGKEPTYTPNLKRSTTPAAATLRAPKPSAGLALADAHGPSFRSGRARLDL